MTPAIQSTEPPAPTAPAPGPEIKLGAPSGQAFGALSPDLVAKLHKVAGSEAPTEVPASPQPLAPTPTKTTTPAPPAPPAVKPSTPPPPKAETPTEEPKGGPKQLREAYERATAKVNELESTVGATAKEKAEAFAKLAAAEERLQSYDKKWKEEHEPLQKAYEEKAKRLQEREEILKIRDYTATEEWQERVDKPIAKTHENITRLLKQVAITDPNTGQQRPATMDDYMKIAQIPYLNAREAAAKQIFGDGFVATKLVDYSGEMDALVENRKQALASAQLESQKYFERQQADQSARLQRLRQVVQERERDYNQRINVGEDAELKAALADGEIAANRYTDTNPATLAPEQLADMIAESRFHVKRSHVLEKKVAKLEADYKIAQEQLAQYMKSEPTVETRNGGEARTQPITSSEGWKADALSKLSKIANSR